MHVRRTQINKISTSQMTHVSTKFGLEIALPVPCQALICDLPVLRLVLQLIQTFRKVFQQGSLHSEKVFWALSKTQTCAPVQIVLCWKVCPSSSKKCMQQASQPYTCVVEISIWTQVLKLPFCHRDPVESQKVLNWALGLPNLDGPKSNVSLNE